MILEFPRVKRLQRQKNHLKHFEVVKTSKVQYAQIHVGRADSERIEILKMECHLGSKRVDQRRGIQWEFHHG